MLFIVDFAQLYFLDISAMLKLLLSKSLIISSRVALLSFWNFCLKSVLLDELITSRVLLNLLSSSPKLLMLSGTILNNSLSELWKEENICSNIFSILQPSIKFFISQKTLSAGDCSEHGDCLIFFLIHLLFHDSTAGVPKFYWYCQNFRGGSFGQVEAVDVGDVAKWRQKLI